VTDETPPLTHERILKAAANALWPLLQTRRWTPHTVKRAISPTGNPRNNTHPTGGNPNYSSPTIEVLSHEPYLRAIATRDQTHLGYGLAIEITRAHALDALSVCSHAELAEYDEALTFANRQPYLWDGVEQAWRRNYRMSTRHPAHSTRSSPSRAPPPSNLSRRSRRRNFTTTANRSNWLRCSAHCATVALDKVRRNAVTSGKFEKQTPPPPWRGFLCGVRVALTGAHTAGPLVRSQPPHPLNPPHPARRPP